MNGPATEALTVASSLARYISLLKVSGKSTTPPRHFHSRPPRHSHTRPPDLHQYSRPPIHPNSHTPIPTAVPTYYYVLDRTVYEVRVHEPERRTEVPEALVHDLWRGQRFDTSGMRTSGGQSLVVLNPGTLNTDAGPDFLQARLQIDGVEWIGDVEIHNSSGTWYAHAHHSDERYNSVILHVTLHTDNRTGTLARNDGTIIPEFVLYGRLEEPLRRLLHRFYTTSNRDILCASRWQSVPDHIRSSWIDQLANERMQHKIDCFSGDALEDILHRRIFAALGYAKNADPMTDLARRIPRALAAQLSSARDLEALHLGIAGLLPAPRDMVDAGRTTADYVMNLRERFRRLQAGLDIPTLPREQWRFFRLRPANFPPIRIAQAAALVRTGGFLSGDVLPRLRRVLRKADARRRLSAALAVEVHPFWDTHVRLERTARHYSAALGENRINIILTNAVAPVMLYDARRRDDRALEQHVSNLLKDLPAPDDMILRRFRRLGTKPKDARHAQGLHQLYRTRCSEARCLQCPVGKYLLQR